MATSSIFSNIKINDPVSAEQFANALEASACSKNDFVKVAPKSPLTDPSLIKNLIDKRKSFK